MDMYDIEKKMENEINKERADFAKEFLKKKSNAIERLAKQQEHLDCKLAAAEEEYDEILHMTIDQVYDKYHFPTGGVIAGTINHPDHDIWRRLGYPGKRNDTF